SSVDLPTLGCPMMATFTSLGVWSSDADSPSDKEKFEGGNFDLSASSAISAPSSAFSAVKSFWRPLRDGKDFDPVRDFDSVSSSVFSASSVVKSFCSLWETSASVLE